MISKANRKGKGGHQARPATLPAHSLRQPNLTDQNCRAKVLPRRGHAGPPPRRSSPAFGGTHA